MTELGSYIITELQPEMSVEHECSARPPASINSVDCARAQPACDVEPTAAPPAAFVPAYTQGLVVLTAADLLLREFPPRELMLAPWLPEKGLAMAFAERGVGKTWIAMNVAYAIASGGAFLRWKAQRARRVVYIDGEMPALTLKERLASIVSQSSHEAADDFLKFVAADLQTDGLPDLASPAGQKFYDASIKDADLIVVDNLSTICRGVRENEADSWAPVQEWCLRQRAAGKSVLIIHHAGKGGGQRGTSKKEDVLDTVIALRRPADYEPSHGARFEVHFTKSRGFYGDDASPFEAHFSGDTWAINEINRADDDNALISLKAQGLSVRQISERTGIAKSTVADKLKRVNGK
jgi:putative DNA primase/helicase